SLMPRKASRNLCFHGRRSFLAGVCRISGGPSGERGKTDMRTSMPARVATPPGRVESRRAYRELLPAEDVGKARACSRSVAAGRFLHDIAEAPAQQLDSFGTAHGMLGYVQLLQ